ncbi:hypothetical protein EPN95_00605 [Patescibacteria group bacterium]|nr:MAG: hypothetical protein EPN95_00605 [Patescibacteria group bacterium]
MTHVRPIDSDRIHDRAAPELGNNARAFVRWRAEALIEAGSNRAILARNDLDDTNIVAAWAQKHAQDAAINSSSERFVGLFDDNDSMMGAIESAPATTRQFAPYESPLDLLFKRRTIKPDANDLAILALLAEKNEGRLGVMVDLLRHTVNKHAMDPKVIYFGVPTDSAAHDAALAEHFEPQGKTAKLFGVYHTLVAREVGVNDANTLIDSEVE